MTVGVLGHSFAYEVECTIRLFDPGNKIQIVHDTMEESDGILTRITREADSLLLEVSVQLGDFAETLLERLPASTEPVEQERALCRMLYRILSRQSGITPPWGILTGVRPVRLVLPYQESGMEDDAVVELFRTRWLTEEGKTRLALATAKTEQGILARNRPDAFSLYVGIPFCPTRCLYCSFVSHAIDKAARLVPDYVRLLCEEIRAIGVIAKDCGLRLQTVYIGGGTPTTLSAAELGQVMGEIAENFSFADLLEYTVEAGRPDTITADKLAVMRQYGADRISINPQTMDNSILAAIGRDHNTRQTREAYHLAREAGFAVINMDLIAGLPGESPEGFLEGLRQVIELEPENITVHTLTVKRSSELREQEDAFRDTSFDLSAMLDKGRAMMERAGFGPYYLYRQKGTRQNLENVGYAKPGSESHYNVYIMEEVHTILAAGAGAVTKLCAAGDLQRVFNFKFPYEYISRFDEILSRKQTIRSFYERD